MPRRIKIRGNILNAVKLDPLARRLLAKFEKEIERLPLRAIKKEFHTKFGFISIFVNKFVSVAIIRGVVEGGLGKFIFATEGLGAAEGFRTLFRYDSSIGEFAAIATPPWSVLPSVPIPSVISLGYNPASGYLYIMENNSQMHVWNNQSEGWLSRAINYDTVSPTTGFVNRPRISFAHGNMYFAGRDNVGVNGLVLWCVPGAGGSTIPSSFDVDDTVSYGQGLSEITNGLGDSYFFSNHLYVCGDNSGQENIYRLSDATTVFTPSKESTIYRLDSDDNWSHIPAASIEALSGWNSLGVNEAERMSFVEYNGALYFGPGQIGADTTLFDVIFKHTGSDTTVEVSTTTNRTSEQLSVSSGGIYALDETTRDVYLATGGSWAAEFDYDMNTAAPPLMFPFDDEVVMLGDFDNVNAVTGGTQYFYNSTDDARVINPILDTSAGSYIVRSAIRLPVELTFDNFGDVW